MFVTQSDDSYIMTYGIHIRTLYFV